MPPSFSILLRNISNIPQQPRNISGYYLRQQTKSTGASCVTADVVNSARRARVDEATINDIGGWAGPRALNSAYDHGLLEEHLEEAQQQVWDKLKCVGYLDGF